MHIRELNVSALFIIAIVMLHPGASLSQSRDTGHAPAGELHKQPEHLMRVLYPRSWAVVVGVNRYPSAGQNFPALQYAVNDARAVAQKLKEIGFEVTLLLDDQALRHNIVKVLADKVGKMAADNNRIVFYFAGHGDTVRQQDGSDMGYILPYNYDPQKHAATAISMAQLKEISSEIKAKHMIYIFDSCFSGGFSQRPKSVPHSNNLTFERMKVLTKSRAHLVFTAGRKDQKVAEEGGHGIFTRALLAALTEKYNMPWSLKGYLTAIDLAQYVALRVPENAPRQSPQFGYFEGEGDVLLTLFKPLDVTAEERERVEKAVSDALEEYNRYQRERLGKELVPPVF